MDASSGSIFGGINSREGADEGEFFGRVDLDDNLQFSLWNDKLPELGALGRLKLIDHFY